MAPGKDSRFCPRAHLTRPLIAEYHHSYPIRLNDLSLTGAFLCEELPLYAGQEIHLTIWLSETEAIEVEAVVRRTAQGAGLGVEFVAMSHADSVRLEEYFRAARAQEKPAAN
jgi:hypothetical protein